MSKPLNVFEVPLKGVSLVEASAGTGKTYNITSLYVRALLEKDLLPAQILVLTFTEDATAELKNRLRQRLIESVEALERSDDQSGDKFLDQLVQQNYHNATHRLQNALHQFDEASVFTIHGFCNRLLNEYSLQFGIYPDFKVIPDASLLLQDCVDEYWRKFIRQEQTPENRFIHEYLAQTGFGPDELQKIVTEVINHPYAKLIPDDVSLDEVKKYIPEFNAAFRELRSVGPEELERLNEILFHEGIKGNIYRKNKRIQLWDSLQNCLREETAQIQFAEMIADLGTKLCDSTKKGYSFEVPDICYRIQHFHDISKRFEIIKPAFVLESLQEIASKFEQRKSDTNVYSYNDFLIKVNEGLQNDATGALAEKLATLYPVSLVDEFQDTDPIQYNIFRQIYNRGDQTALFMIGDPKQAIYGFRGADIYTYLKAKKDAANDQTYHLNFNYRSNDKMIKGVNEIFSFSHVPFHLPDLKFKAAEFPVEKEPIYLTDKLGKDINPLQCITLTSDNILNKTESTERVEQAVENEIIELLQGDYQLNGKKISQKDIAILVRSGKQGERIQQRLRALGIKSILKSNTSIFQTQEANELLIILHSIQNNFSESHIRAALATDLIGKNATEILQLTKDEEAWVKVLQDFAAIKLKWENHGIEHALEALKQSFNILLNLADFIDAERKITNLNHLTDLLAKAEREQHLHGNNLLKWFYRKSNDIDLKTEDDNLRLESDDDLIQISTIHASKGLEYPIVFCPYLWTSPPKPTINDTFRFFKDDQIHIDINTGIDRPISKEAHSLEELRESARLMYVALTRSSAACYLFIPDYKDLHLSALATVTGLNSFAAMKEALQTSPNIIVRSAKAPQLLSLSQDDQVADYTTKDFTRFDMFNFPRILSFSSISHSRSPDAVIGEDMIFDESDDVPAVTLDEPISQNKFTFPRGATAGTFLHNVFEEIDFQDPSEHSHIIQQSLKHSDISLEWEDVVIKWISEVLNHDLGTSITDIKLSSLQSKDVLKEMDFHFPVDLFEVPRLWKLIRGNQELKITEENQISGFMKGYIDLIFRKNGKYYILDYKSNYLGDQQTDYAPEFLKDKMLSSKYDLQYHLYTLALHRMLKLRMNDYDYDHHFGGVLYLFLRGVDVDQKGSGVYFHKPEKESIMKMDAFFGKEIHI